MNCDIICFLKRILLLAITNFQGNIVNSGSFKSVIWILNIAEISVSKIPKPKIYRVSERACLIGKLHCQRSVSFSNISGKVNIKGRLKAYLICSVP